MIVFIKNVINNDLYHVSVLSNNDAMNTMRTSLECTPTDSYIAHEIESTFQQERLNEMYVILVLEDHQELLYLVLWLSYHDCQFIEELDDWIFLAVQPCLG